MYSEVQFGWVFFSRTICSNFLSSFILVSVLFVRRVFVVVQSSETKLWSCLATQLRQLINQSFRSFVPVTIFYSMNKSSLPNKKKDKEWKAKKKKRKNCWKISTLRREILFVSRNGFTLHTEPKLREYKRFEKYILANNWCRKCREMLKFIGRSGRKKNRKHNQI